MYGGTWLLAVLLAKYTVVTGTYGGEICAIVETLLQSWRRSFHLLAP